MAAPGQGQSKKARQRRNKRNRNTSPPTNTTIIQTTVPRQRRRRQNSRPQLNPYTIALIRPEDCKGCKIPDENTQVETGTWQNYYILNLTAGASGRVGLWINPHTNAGLYQTVESGIEGNPITWTVPNTIPGQETARELYQSARLVSGVIRVNYIGNTASDSGVICGGYKYVYSGEMGQTNSSNGVPQNAATWMNNSTTECFPVRNGSRILYKTTDNKDIEFRGFIDGHSFSGVCWGFLATGMQPGQTLSVELIINWEGIPKSATTSFVGASMDKPPIEWAKQAHKVASAMPAAESIFDALGSKIATNAKDMAINYATNEAKKFAKSTIESSIGINSSWLDAVRSLTGASKRTVKLTY